MLRAETTDELVRILEDCRQQLKCEAPAPGSQPLP
jgi:hypothetical protein